MPCSSVHVSSLRSTLFCVRVQLCDRLLSMAVWGGAEGGAWRFWRAFAAAAEGDSVAALADLAVLSGDAFALPVTALSIQIHRNAKVKGELRFVCAVACAQFSECTCSSTYWL